MTNISYPIKADFPYLFFPAFHPPLNTVGMEVSASAPSSWVEGFSSLSIRIFGVVSGVFCVSNIIGAVSKCKEFIYGPLNEIQKKCECVFSRVRLQTDIGRSIGLVLSNALRVTAVVQKVFCVPGNTLIYPGLNIVANCIGILASGCEIVSNIQTIEHINFLLKSKTTLFKKEFLHEHRQSSLFSIALVVGNIGMSILFSLSLVLGSPVISCLAGVVFVLMIPFQCVAIKQKFQISSSHGKDSSCCKVFN